MLWPIKTCYGNSDDGAVDEDIDGPDNEYDNELTTGSSDSLPINITFTDTDLIRLHCISELRSLQKISSECDRLAVQVDTLPGRNSIPARDLSVDLRALSLDVAKLLTVVACKSYRMSVNEFLTLHHELCQVFDDVERDAIAYLDLGF